MSILHELLLWIDPKMHLGIGIARIFVEAGGQTPIFTKFCPA